MSKPPRPEPTKKDFERVNEAIKEIKIQETDNLHKLIEPNRGISHTEESSRYEIKEEVKVSPRNLLSITFCCMELLESIFKDPRVIEFWPHENNTGTFCIVVDDDEIEIRYCPFCGTRIRGIEVNIINN